MVASRWVCAYMPAVCMCIGSFLANSSCPCAVDVVDVSNIDSFEKTPKILWKKEEDLMCFKAMKVAKEKKGSKTTMFRRMAFYMGCIAGELYT